MFASPLDTGRRVPKTRDAARSMATSEAGVVPAISRISLFSTPRCEILEAVSGDGKRARPADDMVDEKKMKVAIARVDDGQAIDGDAARRHQIPCP